MPPAALPSGFSVETNGTTLNIYDLSRTELRSWLVRREINPIHAERIWSYLYLDLAESYESMTEVPTRVRNRLAAETQIGSLSVATETDSRDGFTRKYLLNLADKERIETV